MILVAYFLLIFLLIRFIISLLNFFYKPIKKTSLVQFPLVSVLIPARNEENNIGVLLKDLAQHDYPALKIYVYDDQSTDATALIVKSFTDKDSRFTYIAGVPLPEDWFGKNHACYQLSQKAEGAYFLFLDADVRISKGFIKKIVAHAQNTHVHLLSIFPRQMMKTWGEWLTVPIMNSVLLSLLPLRNVRHNKRAAFSAANGQCMLFDALKYKQIQAHEQVKKQKTEDIALSRLYKKAGLHVECLANVPEIQCRMYHNYQQATDGFAKNREDFFGGSVFVAFLYNFLLTFSLPMLFWADLYLFLAGLLLIIGNIGFVSATAHQSISKNLILTPLQWIAEWHINIKAYLKKNKNQLVWKGRNLS